MKSLHVGGRINRLHSVPYEAEGGDENQRNDRATSHKRPVQFDSVLAESSDCNDNYRYNAEYPRPRNREDKSSSRLCFVRAVLTRLKAGREELSGSRIRSRYTWPADAQKFREDE